MKDMAVTSDLLVDISQLQTRYARCIDADRIEEWPDFFTEDGFYSVTTAENRRAGLEAGLIWLDGIGMIRDRVTALRDANIYERHSYRHVLGQPYVLGESDGGDIEVETSFFVVRITRDGETDVFASGCYHDALRRVDGDLKLSKRIAVCDSSHIDTLLGLPL
ncbi:aromatic-ring-hydroxylating dioxygenase subunit beta [Anianabacter salinae]|uniref:aromatic-ring-hydroxylating dioxygenase subunit beta n=1 Tax=Anianabacter salinae TaxID=2851023 RepID=UPI00225E4638|nr:aromatic-ring-hydroxylating dioxygenase subunit beta [Anianabacter salinae]MBV0913827.1 aromatic-ring-hydroxylating dioxygenase subunit beta [Anianabacter salinae]